jgi:hypothetical protein
MLLAPEEVWLPLWHGSRDWYDLGEHVARGVYNFAPSCSPTSLEVKTTSDPSEVFPLTSILIVWPFFGGLDVI